MKTIKKEAQASMAVLANEIKYEVIRLADSVFERGLTNKVKQVFWYKNINGLVFINVLTALTALSKGYSHFLTQNQFSNQADGPQSAVAFIEFFLKKSVNPNNLEGKRIFDKMVKVLNKNVIPHIVELQEEQTIFTSYDPYPCFPVFKKIYNHVRENASFISYGLISRITGKKEMFMLLEEKINTFEDVLRYGVKNPSSSTADILKKFFKPFWDEANAFPNLVDSQFLLKASSDINECTSIDYGPQRIISEYLKL